MAFPRLFSITGLNNQIATSEIDLADWENGELR